MEHVNIVSLRHRAMVTENIALLTALKDIPDDKRDERVGFLLKCFGSMHQNNSEDAISMFSLLWPATVETIPNVMVLDRVPAGGKPEAYSVGYSQELLQEDIEKLLRKYGAMLVKICQQLRKNWVETRLQARVLEDLLAVAHLVKDESYAQSLFSVFMSATFDWKNDTAVKATECLRTSLKGLPERLTVPWMERCRLHTKTISNMMPIGNDAHQQSELEKLQVEYLRILCFSVVRCWTIPQLTKALNQGR